MKSSPDKHFLETWSFLLKQIETTTLAAYYTPIWRKSSDVCWDQAVLKIRIPVNRNTK